MKRGEQIDLTLQPGFVLAVTCDANVSAQVVRLGDTPGLPPSSPVAAAAGLTTKFGPFMTPTRFTIYGITGSGVLTYSMAAAQSLASLRIISVNITPASVLAATAAEQTFSVPGALALDIICDVGGNTGNSVGIAGARVTAPDTVAVKFINPTAGNLTPGAGVYSFLLAH